MGGSESAVGETADVGIGRQQLSCSRSPPATFPPGGGNPGGQFLIQLVQLNVQYVNSDDCTYLESWKLQGKIQRDIILRRWLRVVCYLHASPPGP